MTISLAFLAVLIPAALWAGVVRGFAGFGGPLMLLPALNIFMPPPAAILVMICIDLLVNVQLLPQAAREANRSVVVPLTIGSAVTMPLGVMLLLVIDPAMMKRGLSLAILLAALVLLSGWRYPGTITRAGWLGVGILTGLVMGSTSLAVTSALFMHAGGQSAAESRANFILWVFVGIAHSAGDAPDWVGLRSRAAAGDRRAGAALHHRLPGRLPSDGAACRMHWCGGSFCCWSW